MPIPLSLTSMEKETGKTDPIEKLRELLTPAELEDLVQAIDSVINFRNGYGNVEIEIKRRRIEQVAITSTLKPGA